MNDDRPALAARVVRRVHPGLTLDATFQLGNECGVLFGPSGAGKTSLLRALAGLEPPETGRISLGDQIILDTDRRVRVPMRLRRIGMIFQDDRLFPHLSVSRNITFGLHGWPRDRAAARRDEVAELCGVTRLLQRDPATLSGGERQRVGLARALAPRPRLLLCDEPVSALDFDARFALLDQLRTIQRAEAIPVLCVTHSPAEAVALGAKLFLLESGAIRDEGDPLDVLGRRYALNDELRNLLHGVVAAQDPTAGETHLRLGQDGPTLIVPHRPAALGTAQSVTVRADDILLAAGPVAGLSARNRIPGVVERVVPHDAQAEVVVRTGGVVWLASVVASAATALELRPGAPVFLIIKARSCRPLSGPPPETVAT